MNTTLYPATDSKGRTHGFFAAPTAGIPQATRRGVQWRGLHGAEQALQYARPMRPASCEESLCEWFIAGREGMDEGKPFTHPAGVQCGDSTRCRPCVRPNAVRIANGATRKKPCGACPPCLAGTANCPCGDRKHRKPIDVDIVPPKHRMAVVGASREVVPDEWKTRIDEGLYARNHILTRGL